MVMRTVLIAALIFSVTLPLRATAVDADAGGENAAPDFALKSLAGPNLRLSEYRGEIVVVAFWASWCGECRGQLQALNEHHEAYGNSGLRILAVNLDRDMRQARETAQALGLNFAVLHDPEGDVAELYDVKDVPLAVFIDREGRIRDSIDGYSRSDQGPFVERLRTLLRD